MFFRKYVRKSDIKLYLAKSIKKAENKLKKELEKKHVDYLKIMRSEHLEYENELKKVIKNHKKQHKRDLRARVIMNDNRVFFRGFKETSAPKILKMISEFANLLAELDRGEVKDARAEKQDPKVIKLHREIV